MLSFNQKKLQSAKKRDFAHSCDPDEGCWTCKQPRKSHDEKAIKCFHYENPDMKTNLRSAMTLLLSERIGQSARTPNDGCLLSRLSAGNAKTQELKYHPGCLVILYSRAHTQKNAENSEKLHLLFLS